MPNKSKKKLWRVVDIEHFETHFQGTLEKCGDFLLENEVDEGVYTFSIVFNPADVVEW